MPSLIYERAIKRDPESGEIISYWEEHWPLSILKKTLLRNGPAFFAASYMNDPSALEGNSLKVAWLHPYLPEELEAARLAAGIKRGVRHIGFDPTMGGESAEADYFAGFCIEMIENRGYALDYMFDRKPVDVQAQDIENFADLWLPNLILVEDTAERGHAYTALTSQINEGRGSKYPVESRQPQSTRNEGGKKMRLQAVAARWAATQIRVPGYVHPETGLVVIDSRWDDFVNQWRVFPAGHDDILDAAYWAAYDLFQDVQPAGGTANGQTPRPATPDVSYGRRPSPRRFGRNRADGRTGLVTEDGRDVATIAPRGLSAGRHGLRQSLTHRDDDFFNR